MAEEGATTKSAERRLEQSETTTSKDQACKSEKIVITPARVRKEALTTVTPADQKNQQKRAEVFQEETSRTEMNDGPILWGRREGTATI
jgi:hypothetical protein